MGIQSEMLRSLGRILQLLNRPLRAGRGIAPYFLRRKTIEQFIVGRMHRHQLSLQMRAQFGDRQAGLFHNTFHLISIGLALRRHFQIDATRIPGRDLNPFKTQ